MSGPDVVGGGSAPDADLPVQEQVRRAAGTARRRRQVGLAATVALAAAAVVLASRSSPDPRTPAPALPTDAAPSPPTVEPGPSIVDFAVGRDAAYALVGSCGGPEQARECFYRVLRRGVGGGEWTVRGLRTERLDAAGFSAELFVTGDDVVTVVDGPTSGRAYVSSDGGDTATMRRLRPGPPVAALPPDGILDMALCESCKDRLTVLEPTTGRLRPLATQPPLGDGAEVRSLAERDGTIWVVGDTGLTTVSAVSVDRGRSWRRVPVSGLRAPALILRLIATDGGGAYLVVGRDSRPDALNEFSELWRIGGPAGPWRPATPTTRPRSALSVLAGDRGLLVGEETGEVWRLRSDGSMRRLPDAVVDGVPIGPGYLVSGPSRVLVALPIDPFRNVLLVSYDEGESWLVEKVPG